MERLRFFLYALLDRSEAVPPFFLFKVFSTPKGEQHEVLVSESSGLSEVPQ